MMGGREGNLEPAVAAAQKILSVKGATPDGVRSALPDLARRFGLASAHLLPVGQKFRIHVQKSSADTPTVDLTGAAEAVPAQRFLPPVFSEKGVMRYRMYVRGSGWGTLRDRIHNHMVDMLYGAFDMLTNQGASETRAQLVQWVNEKKIPPELLEAYDSRGWRSATPRWFRAWLTENVRWHVDHLESLAEHWHHEGFKTDDATRRGHATDLENLDWKEARANLSKGSTSEADESGETQRFHFATKSWVDPDFTSDAAEGGKRGAKLIDGEPFRDAGGAPIQ